MKWLVPALVLFALFALLWVAYRIGKVVLRLAVGLLVLGAAAFAIWRLLRV